MLSRISEAVAATDPDRAARLLADAERIARTIPDKYPKAEVLSRISEAVAATDPDRAARLLADAERIARTMTSGHWKAMTLRDIVKALAPADPDRAEAIADAITIEPFHSAALSHIQRRWPPSTPTAPKPPLTP